MWMKSFNFYLHEYFSNNCFCHFAQKDDNYHIVVGSKKDLWSTFSRKYHPVNYISLFCQKRCNYFNLFYNLLLIDTYINTKYCFSNCIENFPVFTGNDVIFPGKRVIMLENSSFTCTTTSKRKDEK